MSVSMVPRPRRQALRRYPALGFLVAAALLALALPSALRIPPNAPPTLAEIAPVPGQGNQVGDLARLGSGSSEGLGSAGGAPPVFEAPPQPPSSLKRCVGNPPRQTEDPLSPPCVAFFQGDNGGATWRGVTRDEVKVAIWAGPCSSGASCETFVDYANPITGNEDAADLARKIYARYFNARYQTYGRTVRLYGYHGNGSSPQLRAFIGEIDARLRPFALVPTVVSSTIQMTDEAARRGMVVPSRLGFARDVYRKHAPLVYSYAPALEDIAANGASFACRKLAGHPARFSGNPQDVRRERAFGLLYPTPSGENDALRDTPLLARFLKSELKRQCGITLAAEVQMTRDADGSTRAIAALRAAGVTTVILAMPAATALLPTRTATGQGWFPEWFLVVGAGSGGEDDTAGAPLLPQEQWQHAFAARYDVRRGATHEQPWVQAYKEVCPECSVPRGSYAPPRTYDSLSLLFYGIQSAGPRLTPRSLSKGLHAIPRRPSVDPYAPAAYFRAGDYAWIKDAKAVWWDVSGTPPGESQPGCYRLAEGGARYRTGEWGEGDADLFASGQPCQGPNA